MKSIAKMSTLTSNLNPKAASLNATDREKLIYIIKFGLLLSITQRINSRQILDDIYIDDLIIASKIKFYL